MMMSHPYDLTGPLGASGTLGLIVLQTDETIEHDFRRMLGASDIALYVNRIPSGAELTPETIADMEVQLPAAAALLPPAVDFDAVGYACTSASTLIGPENVARLIRQTCKTPFVADPLTATFAALRSLSASSIGLVSPYIETVAQTMKTEFEREGFMVPAALSFGEKIETHVARIDGNSLRAAAKTVAETPGLDAIFLSCTNLRTLDIIEDLEADLGIPVFGSNLALCWRMVDRIGALDKIKAPGRLFRLNGISSG